jgi:hypothetical protein
MRSQNNQPSSYRELGEQASEVLDTIFKVYSAGDAECRYYKKEQHLEDPDDPDSLFEAETIDVSEFGVTSIEKITNIDDGERSIVGYTIWLKGRQIFVDVQVSTIINEDENFDDFDNRLSKADSKHLIGTLSSLYEKAVAKFFGDSSAHEFGPTALTSISREALMLANSIELLLISDDFEKLREGIEQLERHSSDYPELLKEPEIIKALVDVIQPSENFDNDIVEDEVLGPSIASLFLKMGDPALEQLAQAIECEASNPEHDRGQMSDSWFSLSNALENLNNMLGILMAATGGPRAYPQVTVRGVLAIREKLEKILPVLTKYREQYEYQIYQAELFLDTLTVVRRDDEVS